MYFWPEHNQFFEGWANNIQYFNIPKLSEDLVPWLFNYLQSSISSKKQSICLLLVKMIYYNHHTQEWLDIITKMKTEYGESNSCYNRTVFLYFFSYSLNLFSFDIIKTHLIDTFL